MKSFPGSVAESPAAAAAGPATRANNATNNATTTEAEKEDLAEVILKVRVFLFSLCVCAFIEIYLTRSFFPFGASRSLCKSEVIDMDCKAISLERPGLSFMFKALVPGTLSRLSMKFGLHFEKVSLSGRADCCKNFISAFATPARFVAIFFFLVAKFV